MSLRKRTGESGVYMYKETRVIFCFFVSEKKIADKKDEKKRNGIKLQNRVAKKL